MYGFIKLYIDGTTGIIKGMIIIVATKAKSEPITVSFTASNPFPSNNNLCPGNTPMAISASGAPRKIEGMESRNVCVTAIDIIKTAKTKGSVKPKRYADKDSRIKDIRFTWIPGIKPVMIPAKTPNRIAVRISKNINQSP